MEECVRSKESSVEAQTKMENHTRKITNNGVGNGHPRTNNYERNRRSRPYDIFIQILSIAFSLVAWVFLIFCVVLPLAPFVGLFILAKHIERYVFWFFRGVESITGGDCVWMSNGPENPGIISALMIFNGDVGLQEFRQRIFATMIAREPGSKTLHPYRRSTKTVSTSFLNYLWTEEEEFDVNEHVRLYPRKVSSKSELRHVVSEICTLPFRKGMSQWDLVIIPWIQNGVHRTGAVFRVNHSVADGGALINYLTNVLPDQEREPVKLKKFSQSGRFLLYLKGILFHPLFLVKMILGVTDSTVLHGKPLTGKKVVTWSESMDIDIFKKVKTLTQSTLNDVLVSCLAASIREFFVKRNLEPPKDLKVSVPIDLRKNTESDAVEFENRFAVLQVSLPIGCSDPLGQLYELQDRMNALKSSGEPFAVGLSMELFLNILPTSIVSPFFDFIVQKCTAVLSNLPGPQDSLTIVGQKLESLTFWAPPRGNLGMTFSITSYDGKVVVGVQSDTAILDDPDEICKEFPVQVQRLLNRLNLNQD